MANLKTLTFIRESLSHQLQKLGGSKSNEIEELITRHKENLNLSDAYMLQQWNQLNRHDLTWQFYLKHITSKMPKKSELRNAIVEAPKKKNQQKHV